MLRIALLSLLSIFLCRPVMGETKIAPIMVVDGGFDHQLLAKNSRVFDLEALIRQNLLDVNLRAGKQKKSGETPNHLGLVINAMTTLTTQILPVLEPSMHLSLERRRTADTGIEFARKLLLDDFATLDQIIKTEGIRVVLRTTTVAARAMVETLCYQYRHEPVLMKLRICILGNLNA